MTDDYTELYKYKKYKSYNRFEAIHDFIQNKVNECCRCGNKKTNYILIDGKFHMYYEDKETRAFITSEDIKKILENITKEDLETLGLNETTHPKNLILENLPVIPICCRPYIISERGIHDDDLTTKYIEIIKINNKIKVEEHTAEKQLYINLLEFHIRTFMDNSKKKSVQNSGRPIKCIRKRLDGKDGLVRNNLSGKRTDFSARTVIGPDIWNRVDTITIPTSIAQTITFPERAYSRNMSQLQKLVEEGRANYVVRNGDKFDLKHYSKTKVYILQKGDFIIRDNKKIDPVKYQEKRKETLLLLKNDKIMRNGEFIKPESYFFKTGDIIYRKGKRIQTDEPQKGDTIMRRKEYLVVVYQSNSSFVVKEGDVVERHLVSGDTIYFNRQPSKL